MPITEIALRSGFSTSAAFSKAFRQAKGSTPSEFRKLQTGQEICPFDSRTLPCCVIMEE